MNTLKTKKSNLVAAFVLLLSFFAVDLSAATIKWSSLSPKPTTSTDVTINDGDILQIDVNNAVCKSLKIGSYNNPANSPATLEFVTLTSGTGVASLTVSGIVTANTQNKTGNTSYITFTQPGRLTCGGFSKNTGSTFIFTKGTGTVEITGTTTLTELNDFHNLTFTGATTLSTDITVSGNFAHNAAFVPNSKRVTFNGTADQTISGSATPSFYNVTVNKSGGKLILGRPININNNLTLTSSNIELGMHNLTMVSGSTISGGSASSYIKADGTGKLFMTVYKNSSTVFPIGINPYIPLTIKLPNAASTPSSVEFAVGAESGVKNSANTSTSYLTSNAVNNSWDVTPGTAVNDVIISLAWPSSQNLTSYNASNSFIVYREKKATGVASIWASTSGTTPSNISATAPNYSQSTPTFNFPVANMASEFAVGDGASQFGTSVPLPVEFISFTATKQGADMAMLNFSTAWEVNNAGFEVERSTNGISWNKIGFVPGHGNTTEIKNYAFETSLANVNSAVVYYRLKQIDFNGQFEYSATRTIRLSAAAAKAVSVYPNPATSRISVSLEGVAAGEMAKISVMDMSGKILISANQMVEEGNFTVDMNIDNLTKGNYIVNISSASANYNTKLVKF